MFENCCIFVSVFISNMELALTELYLFALCSSYVCSSMYVNYRDDIVRINFNTYCINDVNV